MASRSPRGDKVIRDSRALADIFLHPVRGRLLSALTERSEVTVAGVARRVGESPRRVRYHLDTLAEQGLIERRVVGDEHGRSIRYSHPSRIIFDDFSDLDPEHQFATATEIARTLLGDVGVAAAAGTLAHRKDDILVRIYGEVDDDCVAKLATIHGRVCREMLKLTADARQREPLGDGSETEVVSALFFFEAPLWGRSVPEGTDARGPRRLDGTGWGEGAERHGYPVEPTSEEMRPLVEAMTHDLKGRIVIALSDRPRVTVRELASRLGEPPHRVRHALEALKSAGLIVVTDELVGRGTVERRYAARPWAIEETRPEQLALSRAVLRLLIDDLGVAADAGTLGTRADEFQWRFYVQVDEDLWNKMAEILWSAYYEILGTVETGRERVREGGESGTEIVSALFLFEAPLWDGPRSPS